MKEPSPSSTNETERLFAEPEVQQFTKAIQQEIHKAILRSTKDGGEMEGTAELLALLGTLMTRPVAGYVEDFQIHENVDFKAGAILNAGEKRQELQQALDRLIAEIEKETPVGMRQTAEGESWWIVQIDEQTPEIQWGWKDNYLILGVGKGSAEQILERLSGSPPGWLSAIRQEHAIERESTLTYVNIPLLLERLQPVLDEQQRQIVENLALGSIGEMHTLSGFDEKGCTSVSHLVTDGSRRGIFSLIPYKPLSKRDFNLIPRDVLIAYAIRLDVEESWEALLRLIGRFSPEAEDQAKAGLRKLESQTGVDVRDDVIGSLGDVTIGFLPEGDLMSSWLGAAIAVQVKDADALRPALDRLTQLAISQLSAEEAEKVSIQQTLFGDLTIHHFNSTDMPIAPAWCISDNWLIVGLMPQAVRSALERDGSDSLAEKDAVQGALDVTPQPTSVFYCDSPQLVRSIYPWLQIAAQSMSAEMSQQGFELNTALIPRMDTLVKHMRPYVSTMRFEQDGYHFNAQSTLPGGANSMALSPFAVGLLLPAVNAAREAARINEELNNMKQISLSCAIYEDKEGHYPRNIADTEGNALLSWRVAILPYLERQELYDEFHLDEPWDSPHNLPLASRVVESYQSPTQILEDPRLTCYQTFVGQGVGMLGTGPRGVTIPLVRDGTSNTIQFVRTAPEEAVPWTKPEDLEFNSENPFQGLRTSEGIFPAAFFDGHVRRISTDISAETMRALATLYRGDVIDKEELNR